MGMFDYVDYQDNCFKCGEPLGNFQSKDADCTLDTISPAEVKSFYTSCNKCRTWHDYRVIPHGYTVVLVPPELEFDGVDDENRES